MRKVRHPGPFFGGCYDYPLWCRRIPGQHFFFLASIAASKPFAMSALRVAPWFSSLPQIPATVNKPRNFVGRGGTPPSFPLTHSRLPFAAQLLAFIGLSSSRRPFLP